MASKKTKNSSPSGRFYPQILNKSLRYPWLGLAACIILGALLGFLLSFFFQPIYEAEALVTTNLELVQTHIVTEIMVDAQINQVGTLVFHPDVVEGVIASEAAAGNVVSLEDLKAKATVERQLMSTIIKVRDANPQTAARIASVWAEILYQRLSKAYPSAVQVSAAKMQLNILLSCADMQNPKPNPICVSITAQELAEQIASLERSITAETPKTLGLTSALNVSQYQAAAVPSEPQNYLRSNLIFAGMLLGLVGGLVLLEALPAEKRK